MVSINEELDAFPELRRPFSNAIGMILQSPRTGLVYVPFDSRGAHWSCVVVYGDTTYPRGGHHIVVSDKEVIRSPEVMLALQFVGKNHLKEIS